MGDPTNEELAERLSAQAATFERNYGGWDHVDDLRLALAAHREAGE